MSRKFSTFVDLLRYRASEQPEKVVFTFLQDGEIESGQLTYQQLEAQSRAIAGKLQNLNAQGERALLLYPPGLEFIVAFLGCLYAGVIAVPAYPPRPNRSIARLEAIVADAQAKFTLTTQSLLSNIEERLTQTAKIHCLATDIIGAEDADSWQESTFTEDNLAFLQYTSGSTGTPKGVMVSHGNLIHNSGAIKHCFQNNANTKVISWLPAYHDMGLIGGILQPIYVGISMVLIPPVAFLQRPIRWLQTISRYQGTTSGGPNFAYEMCVNQITPEQRETLDLRSWELAFSGAEPVRASTLERFANYFQGCGFRKEAFYPCYGMAEATLLVSGGTKGVFPACQTLKGKALEQNQVIPTIASELGSNTIVSCGKTVKDQQIVIVNPETRTPCAPDEIGEIWVSGPSVAQGYWQRPVQTEETFQAYLANNQAGPFLRTGDLGFLHEGELFVTGRLKDLIIIRGRNHYPQDIELTVEKSHPSLRSHSGAAFAVEIKGEEKLVLVQEVKRTYLRHLNVDEVTNAIRKAVIQAHELQPVAIALLKTGSILKTSSGKITRQACKSAWEKAQLNVMGEWQETGSRSKRREDSHKGKAVETKPNQIQSWLVAQLGERLGISAEEIDVRESFASYGLDSVQAVRLSAELEDWLGRKLPPTLAYDYPTIASLAEYLGSLDAKKPQPWSKQLISSPKSQIFNEPIAIIGLGCRFPGAENPVAFWELLHKGEDAITQVKERWQNWSNQSLSVPPYGGFLSEVELFDPQFFGISPREAQSMDPQQRLLLEVSWEAIENAGIPADKLSGSSTGVFVGISSYDYSQLQFSSQKLPDAYAGTGNAHSIAANRLSYTFDLRGPSLTVDTACSSSLVAVHLACQSLRQGECDQALIGGVNLILSPELTLTFAQAGMIAADGHCKTFDASADGYVRGEGCGVALLKRLSDAIGDGDNILAVIRGSAVNQDGRSNGLTAPNGPAQQAVIRQSLANAGVSGSEISYVEAHGTGTSLGDPIEVNSLTTILSPDRPDNFPCYLGSVKTNVGHLEAAAGIAGLLKITLALQQEEIPPHLNLKQLNPHIPLDNTPITIPTQPQPWLKGKFPRLAGVSSFGFGGTNAHVIVAEAPEIKVKGENTQTAIPERPQHLLLLSAKNEQALVDLVKSYEAFLADKPQLNLANVCFTANTGRSHFNHRLAAVAGSMAQLQAKLAAFTPGKATPGLIQGESSQGTEPKIAFLFTGQGSQYEGMGEQLYRTQPTFAAALDRCAEILTPYLEQPLLEVLYPAQIPNPKLHETAYTQPCLFALEYALAQLWLSWGVQPSVVMGHSVGEYVAACIAGVFSVEDGLKLIAQRARLMQALPDNGEMVAVFAAESEVQSALATEKEQVAIAAINGFENIVISGVTEAVAKVVVRLKSQGLKTRKLKVSHAFHSSLMEPMLAEFAQVTRQINYSCPRLDLVSNVTGKLAGEEIATPEYWVNHVRQGVQFAPSMEQLKQQGYQIFLEIGPQPTLLGMGRHCLPEVEGLWLPSLRPGQEDWQQMLDSLARLAVSGCKIDWLSFEANYPRRRVALPTYPFQRQRYWLDQQQIGQPQRLTPTVAIEDWFYQVSWQSQSALPTPDSSKQEHGSWLVFADRGGVGEKIEQQLTQQGKVCFLVYPGDRYQSLSQTSWELDPTSSEDFDLLFQEVVSARGSNLEKIVHLWSLDIPETEQLTLPELEKAQVLGCASVLSLIQSISGQSITPRIWLVTQGTQAVGEKLADQLNSVEVAQSPLWGLGQVVAIEHPELWGGMVDLAPRTEPQQAEELVAAIANSTGEDRLALRQGQSYVARLKPFKLEPTKGINLTDETYLITGGLGALGLKIAQWLVAQGAKHLVLVSRSQASDSHQPTLANLKEQGANLIVAQADVAQEEDLRRVFREIEASLPPLRGIIHAAGILDDGLLSGLSWESLARVMAPKVQGTWNLHRLTENMSLDFFLLFSSAASLLGSPGQGNYAAANAFLDAIAHYRRAQGLPALSINWGPWAETGMAVSTRLSTRGLNLLPPERALEALAQLISQPTEQVGVISVQWAELQRQFPELVKSPYFQEWVGNVPETTKIVEPDQIPLFEELESMSLSTREDFLITYLKSLIAQVLQLEVGQISAKDSLLDLGMDSLMVMEAVNQLKHDLQLMLYPREFYERPRIDALAKYLAVEFERSHGPEQPSTAPAQLSLATGSEPPTAPKVTTKRKRPTENQLPAIAFILSGPRCGSTLLRVMLAGHPALCSPPELHLLPFATMAQRSQELELSHLGEGLQRGFMELKGIDAQASQRLVDDLIKQNCSIKDVYEMLIELAGDRLLVDKSPTYGSSLHTLERAEELFAGAKYIHLVRHPYGAIESFARMRMDKLVGSGNANPYQLGESIWTTSNQNILDFAQEISSERYHQVRYEELVTEPTRVMEELCQFLGIPFDPALLNPYEGMRMTDGIHAQSLSVGDPNFLQRRQIEAQLGQAWQKIELPSPLGESARRIAISLGYELINEPNQSVISEPKPVTKETSPLDYPMSEDYLDIRGLKLCLCSWGPKAGPLVLCLHGILEQGAAWLEVAIRLAEKGYRVIAPDLRGHGRSDHVSQGDSYNLLDFLGDVDGIVKEITDKPVTLVGHSFGSVLAAMFASIRPQKVKDLFLVETVLPSEVNEDEAVEQLATQLDYLASPPEQPIFPNVATAAQRLRLATPALSESLSLYLAQRILETCQGGVRWRWASLLRTRVGIGFNGIDKSKYLTILRRIKAPITLVYGDKSDFNRPEDLAQQQEAMPQAKRVVIPGGHNLHLEAAAALATIIVL